MSGAGFRITVAGQALIEEPVEIAGDAAVRLAGHIRASDMAAVNFEGTLGAPHAWPLKAKTMHVATPAALQSLRSLGFSALGLANNHAFDLGPPALTVTRTQARACGFATAGSGDDIASACAPAIVNAGGRSAALFAFDLGPQPDMVYATSGRAGINPLRIRTDLVLPAQDLARLAEISRTCGYEEKFARRVKVGYSDALPDGRLDFFGISLKAGAQTAEHRYADPHDLERALHAIREARRVTEFVVVSAHSHHWETNWAAAPRWLDELCVMLVDAGADVVFCHGSPVLQGMTIHRGKPVFYGLGNLIFHTARAPRYDHADIDVWRSAVATCEFDNAGTLREVRIVPIRVGLPLSKTPGSTMPAAPEVLEGEQADKVIGGFLTRSRLGTAEIACEKDSCAIRMRD